MKKIIAITVGSLLFATVSRAQWVVYDPTMNVQQILNEVENLAEYGEMIDNEVEQIQTMTSQLEQLQNYNTAFGNPAAIVNVMGASQVSGDLNKPVVGESLGTIQADSQGEAAMTFNGNGIYQSIGTTFKTPSGHEIQREDDLYRDNAAVQNATENYTNVYADATQRRLTLRKQIAATVQKIQSATTASEVQKLTGVLMAQDADLADTDKEIDQAASLALVQEVENQDDENEQSKARLEEQQAEFSEALTNYGTAFQPMTGKPVFPTQ
jgi:membrane-associated HD superfamily phosphohydrolase